MNVQAMADPSAPSEANPLPTSAEIIGFLVKTLEVELGHDIKARTWRNYITGKPVSEKTQEAIFDALTLALLGPAVPTGDVPLPSRQVAPAEEVIRGIRDVLMFQARHWDDIRAQLPAGASPKAVPLLAIIALRLAIIDLALRVATLFVLRKDIQPPKERTASEVSETPELEDNVLGQLLRELIKLSRLTRDEFARKLGVSKQALDKWLDGRELPPALRLEEIVDLVVKQTGTTRDSTPVRLLLRGLRLLSKLVRPLEAFIGHKQFEQLGLAFLRITRSLWLYIARIHIHPEEFQAQMYGELILLGSHSGWGQHILRESAPEEKDIVWSGLIRAAGMDWADMLTFIQQVANNLASMERIANSEGLRHIDLEEQAETSLLMAFAPDDALPVFLSRLRTAPPEHRAMANWYFLGLRLEGIRELPDGPEKRSELARLAESCRLAASTSPWQPESFNCLAWLCHGERILLLLQPFNDISMENRATLVRAGREFIAALDDAPRTPPPADMRNWNEHMSKLREQVADLCDRLEAMDQE
ncbi:helix-turn-helix transcriptional regulator [Vitiosangium sp. GDMCC 1.1324]|uniref:helix-turn-helix domain-containing protein n=1 Tax=Vitiosangium sp. (strain GDMCC 1.1324) TaxID=2138576 RepID=UPI000D3911AF|nr:helix-turn-helix transcriptional regulator [Vitiosangium sp. GDMCC 1.1324]PTL79990.1 hypothetical protein DAT35_31725 [Vitiosangium sp. GDMCC 1.1324]